MTGRTFQTLGVVGHVEKATEDIRELIADQALTPQLWRPIEAAIVELCREARIAAERVTS